MSISRLKTLVIILLVLLNILFLTIIIRDTVVGTYIEKQAVENICELLRLRGISIKPEAVGAYIPLSEMKTTRDIEAEAMFAAIVLDETKMTDQGVIYHYENEQRGIAKFFSAGDFEIRLNPGVISSTNDRVKTVRELLRDMKLEISYIALSGEPERETVAATCAYKKASIFNCIIEFVFNGDNLELIRGRYITGIVETESSATLSTAGTALLGLYRAVKSGEISCTSVESIEAGYYYLVAGSFGEGSMVPTWFIVTDNGSYMLEEGTGNIKPV